MRKSHQRLMNSKVLGHNTELIHLKKQKSIDKRAGLVAENDKLKKENKSFEWKNPEEYNKILIKECKEKLPKVQGTITVLENRQKLGGDYSLAKHEVLKLAKLKDERNNLRSVLDLPPYSESNIQENSAKAPEGKDFLLARNKSTDPPPPVSSKSLNTTAQVTHSSHNKKTIGPVNSADPPTVVYGPSMKPK